MIPQSNENLQVTFTATFWDNASSEENPIRTGKFVASLKYDNLESVVGTEANKWTAGFRYNYTATVNASQIEDTQNPTELYPIKFEVNAVEGWKDASQSVTPSANN